jgi:hypothetical protein
VIASHRGLPTALAAFVLAFAAAPAGAATYTVNTYAGVARRNLDRILAAMARARLRALRRGGSFTVRGVEAGAGRAQLPRDDRPPWRPCVAVGRRPEGDGRLHGGGPQADDDPGDAGGAEGRPPTRSAASSCGGG